MNRIEGQRGAGAASRTNEAAIRARIEKELAGGAAMMRAQLTKVIGKQGLSATTYQYLQVAGKIAKQNGEELGLAEFAKHHGLDLAKCGPELALYAPKGPRDLMQRAPARAAADDPPDQVLARVLSKIGYRGIENGFYRDGTSGFSTLQALGQLKASDVRARAGANVDRLRATAFSAFRGFVADRVQQAVGKALARVKQLLGDARARQAFLDSFPTTEARSRALRALGVDGTTARELAAGLVSVDPGAELLGHKVPSADARLVAALEKAASALDTVHRWASSSVLREEVAVGLFASMKPVVAQLRRELAPKEGSFLDEAIRAGLKKGEAILRRDAAVRFACGIACSVILAGIGGPLGAALAAKGAKAAVFEGQAIASARYRAARVGTAEGMGLADRAETIKARRALDKQLLKSAISVGIDGVSTVASAGIGKALGEECEPVKKAVAKGASLLVSTAAKEAAKAGVERAR
jgi:hypothetical protein